MAIGQMQTVLKHLRKTLAPRLESAASDGELLERFLVSNDQAAFELLVWRHHRMVLGVCSRILADSNDVEDAFQATFLVLSRQGRSIRKRSSLSSWLFGVARRVALAASRGSRRLQPSLLPLPSSCPEPRDELMRQELRGIVDEELGHLPEKYRAPVVLCYLEGLTYEAAGQQLGCSRGTISTRLTRARELLRRRLAGRGLAVSTGALVAWLCANAASAGAPGSLGIATIKAVTSIAAGQAPTMARVAALTQVVLKTTTTFKGLAMKAAIASLVVVGLGVGIYATLGRADPARPVEEKKKTEGPNATAKRVDALGDPLPDGAIMRLGTRRFRAQAWPWEPRPVYWQSRPDGKSYLARQGSEIRRIDLTTGVVLESWPLPKSTGALAWAGADDHVVGFSPDGRYVLWTNDYIHHGVVDVAQEWHLALYDLTERKQVWSIAKNLEPKDWPYLGKCVFTPNNKWFVTARLQGSGANDVRLWDARTGKQLWQHHSKGQSLSLIGFVDAGETVVLRGDNDGYIYLFDRAKGTEKNSFPTVRPQCWGQILLSPDGKQVVICTSQPPSVWDLEGKQVAVLGGHKTWANAAAFSPDGKKLFTGSYDSFVLEREWPSGKPIRKIELGRDRLQRLASSPDGKRLQVVFEGEQALIFYDLETGKQLPELIAGHRGAVYGVECAPDGSLVSFGCDRTIRTWDLKQGKSVAQIAVELDLNGRTFALSADGGRVAVRNYDVKSIGIYDRLTGKRQRNIPTDPFSNQHLAFSPDGRFLAGIGPSRRSAEVWDIDSGKPLLKAQARNSCNSVAGAFSPDGRTFAFGDGAFGDGAQVRMWDTVTWKEGAGIQAVITPWGFSPSGLAYSPDGRTIATASEFGDGVRLYEVATRRLRAHVQPPGSTTGLLRFSHDGRLLAWVNNRNTIHVLDVRTGMLAGPFKGHDDAITGLAFTIDDRALASSSGDCTILIWGMSAKTAARAAPAGNLDEAWQAMLGEDAQKALTAIRTLTAQPETAVKIASEHLKPAEQTDPHWLAARLRDLDNQKFSQRERATHELEECGDRALPALDRFLASKPSAEARQRAERILAKIRARPATGQAARSLRALEALEWIGTAKARELVEKLAKGAEGVSFTLEAKRSLKRWKSETN
jgi:RNA polymerase sigma factor (sigma-70 family)